MLIMFGADGVCSDGDNGSGDRELCVQKVRIPIRSHVDRG